MNRKKWFTAFGLMLFLGVISFPYGQSYTCFPFAPTPCGLMQNARNLFGTVMNLKGDLQNKIHEGVPVRIQEESGKIRSAILQYKWTLGRNVKENDIIDYNCSEREIQSTQMYCTLKFRDPKAPPIHVPINDSGVPKAEILVLGEYLIN